MVMSPITSKEFELIREWLYLHTSIHLNDSKKTLVSGRLQKRVNYLGLKSLLDYYKYIVEASNQDEAQQAINLLTTNETYFFREKKHYDFLRHSILDGIRISGDYKVWSAASSTGEEAYTTALIMADMFGIKSSWKILGTDINTDVIVTAKKGVYPIESSQKIPIEMLKKYCVKGVGRDDGFFKFKDEMIEKVNFTKHNLIKPLPINTRFDLVFLRNVLIYFDIKDKKRIVSNIMSVMKPGAWLLVGHSESVSGYNEKLKQIKPGCYQYVE